MLKNEMTNSDAVFYYTNHFKNIDILEKAFLEFKDQINFIEKQYFITVDLYLKNRQEELDNLENTYFEVLNEAKEGYENELDKENFNDDYKIYHTKKFSGIDAIIFLKNEDISEIKLKYSNILDLFSKSTLISLYSLNETFLNRICEIASVTFKQKITISHFNSRDYLIASFNYLELVIDIPQQSLESYIFKLKQIQKIRNKIIHSGSKSSELIILDIIKANARSFHHNNENQFIRIISAQFIIDFIDLLNDLYNELFWLFEYRQNYKTLKNIFENWFRLIDNKIIISEITCVKTTKKSQTLNFIIESDNKKIQNLKCKLTFNQSESKGFSIIDQTENELIKKFIEINKNGIYIELILKTFTIFKKNNNINLIIY